VCGQTISCVSYGVTIESNGVLMSVVRLISSRSIVAQCGGLPNQTRFYCNGNGDAWAEKPLDIRNYLINRSRFISSLRY